MIYPIDRPTPSGQLDKIPESELQAIADKVKALGINTEVYY
jgi:hypothetical protein